MALTKIKSEGIKDGEVKNADMADDAVGVAELSATGTASSSTFLRGDNSWATPTDTNTVTTINNNADNRVITGSGTANTLNGESGLTYDSGGMAITGDSDRDGLKITQSGNNYGELMFNSNRSSANNALGIIRSEWNSTEVASIYLTAGSDTTNKDDGQIKFMTSPDSGTGIQTRMLIDSSGNMGFNNTAPSFTSGTGIHLGDNTFIGFGAGGDSRPDFQLGSVDGSLLSFRCGFGADTNDTNINTSGDVLVGCSNTDSNNSTGIRLLAHGAVHATRNAEYGYIGRREGSDGGVFLFRRDANNVGSISVSYTATAFNTSSDYRLKENVTAISDGITRLKTLKPSRFNFKSNKDLTVDGFLAHEVTAVPEAISGTKDAVATEDSEEAKKGDPIYQQIDQSKLVPLLTAALQEAVAKIETLETKVAALEAG